MADATMSDEASRLVGRSGELAAAGDARAAIELLTSANRRHRSPLLEVELVRLRREAASGLPASASGGSPPFIEPSGSGLVEVEAAELDLAALRAGFAQSGCLLVRGLVPLDRVERLVDGIDSAIAASDAAAAGATDVDPGWYSPGPMPDRVSNGLPEDANRRFLRERGGLWTADSPHMLFELFELVDDVGIGQLMTDYLGERPLLSALKCTLRRVPPDLIVMGGWHQDGSFLGDTIGAFNFWLSLSRCGRDAPGLDLVPKRVARVLQSDEGSRFDWSLSEAAVSSAAGETSIVRPDFEPGDALLFDHLLVHRTATSLEMTRPRHAIESWFFAPSAYPVGQLPIFY